MSKQPTSRLGRCPICKKARAEEFKPFCSRGCRDRDLNRWFNDDYSTPGEPVNIHDIAEQD